MVNIYELALARTTGIGPRIAIELLKHIGSAEELFKLNRNDLQTIFKTKHKTIDSILNKTMFPICEQELNFITKYNIHSYFLTDNSYPQRLKDIPDTPICLFVDGKGDLNKKHIVSIVGSRQATDYGRMMTDAIVRELKSFGDIAIISGLAYGIDSMAHRQSLSNNIPTFGVLGHGLDMIYPKDHYTLSQQMKENGGLITEYFSHTPITPYNFPQRNRIIAGLSDLVIVVEAAKTGGALITARLANDYNRDVLAVPGRCNDKYSEGCHFLIESNRANILSSPKSIAKLMMWDDVPQQISNTIETLRKDSPVTIDAKADNLKGRQKKIYSTLKEKGELDIDTLAIETNISVFELSALLLELELEDYVRSKPGKVYKAL